jgi:Metallo-beta-lactamase superfamily
MPPAPDFDSVALGLFIWQNYSREVKADLFSTAIDNEAGLFIVDPIPLDENALMRLRSGRKIAGIIVSNANHRRAANEFARELRVPIFVAPMLATKPEFAGSIAWQENDPRLKDLTPILIEGAGEGEIVIHCARNGGTLIIGDALINFGSHGFDFLPPKYCSDAKQMRRSLPKLLDLNFERILFAHGLPILKSAKERLQQLLG